MKRFRLTTASKVLILILVIGLAIGGIYLLISKGILDIKKTDTNNNSNSETQSTIKQNNNTTYNDNTINISIDDWIAYSPIIYANKGLTTKSDSIFGKLGINVNIKIINDDEECLNALLSGEINATCDTINHVALLSQTFKEQGFNAVIPLITDNSSGGDAIISNPKYQSVEDLIDAKIAVDKYSVSHSLIIYFISKSDLSQSDKNKILDNIQYYDTMDDVVLAYMSGKADVIATWQPYITEILNTTNSHILFTTKSSTKIILGTIVFNKDWVDKNEDVLVKFIDGVLQAQAMYDSDFTYIKEAFSSYADMSDNEILDMTKDAILTDWTTNIKNFDGIVQNVYTDMCIVWETIGAKTDKGSVKNIFDNKYLLSLSDKYKNTLPTNNQSIIISEDKLEYIKNTQALLTKTCTINFLPNTAKFIDNYEASKLDEFINIANVLDGTIIQIEGNISGENVDNDDALIEAGQQLSEERAKAIAKYFIANGIDSSRIIIIGNGSTKPIGDNNTEEGRNQNRRTDIFFKAIE